MIDRDLHEHILQGWVFGYRYRLLPQGCIFLFCRKKWLRLVGGIVSVPYVCLELFTTLTNKAKGGILL